MQGLSLHLGRYSAPGHIPPLHLIDLHRHDEGYALWIGPIGFVLYTRRWQSIG
jgi:hypothetical protein